MTPQASSKGQEYNMNWVLAPDFMDVAVLYDVICTSSPNSRTIALI